MTSKFLDQINWNEQGLVPVITIDSGSGRLLMMAWANREAVQLAVAEKRGIYWSRSRGKIWRKGEQSGQIQILVDLFLDCDNDALCYVVDQADGVACHTGRQSCFFKRLEAGTWIVEDPVMTDPGLLYPQD